MTSLSEIITAAEGLWPEAGAESWDRSGLIIGDSRSEISKVLMSVDVTNELVDEAIAAGFDLVISHHPVLLRSADSISVDTAKQKLFAKANAAGLAIFAAHTNADITATGVSASLSAAVGLQQLRPLVATTENLGHGRVGRLPSAMSLLEFARRLATVLPSTATGIRVAGDPELQVSTVALCGGAGDSFIADALATDADLYLTSDLRHHPVQEAMQLAKAGGRHFAMIDISHWAAEWIWLDTAKAELAAQFPQVTFEVSDLRTDPWDFVVTQ